MGGREEEALLAAAAARPRLGGPGESGGPRREGGRRRAGGDSQTPVSLAAAERALPRPAHCGHRVLYNSAVRHRGRDSQASGPSFGTGDPSRGWGWGGRREAEGWARRPALSPRQFRAGAARPAWVRGGRVRCCRSLEVTRPPPPPRNFPKGREGEDAKVRKKPGLAAPAAAGVSRRRSGMGMGPGLSVFGEDTAAWPSVAASPPLRFPGEGGEGGAAAAARAHKRGAPGVRPQRGRPRAPGPGRGLRSSSRPDRLRPGVRATAASGGGRDIGAAQGSKCSANSFPTGGLPWFRK